MKKVYIFILVSTFLINQFSYADSSLRAQSLSEMASCLKLSDNSKDPKVTKCILLVLLKYNQARKAKSENAKR